MADEKSHRGDSSLWRKPREILGLRAIKPTPEVEARALRGFFATLSFTGAFNWSTGLSYHLLANDDGIIKWREIYTALRLCYISRSIVPRWR